jgi:undecaprenyl-diphosphatase
MTLFQAYSGYCSGITEFLPISSSGHLVLTPFLMGWEIDPEFSFPFGVLIQLGTLVAVFIYFKEDLTKIIKNVLHGVRTKNYFDHPDSALGWKLIGATIPAGVVGLLP